MKYAIEIGWDLNGVIAEVKMDAALDAVLWRLKVAGMLDLDAYADAPRARAALRAALHDWTPPRRPREETLRRRQAYVDSWKGCGHRVEHPALDDDGGWLKVGKYYA